jgi:hypothetical protein
VVLELASAKQVVYVCRLYSTTWKTLRENVHYQEDKLTWGYHPYVTNMLNVWKPDATQPRSCSSLLGYLSKFRYCGATDPRDKVFALIGLATDQAAIGLEAIYDLGLQDSYQKVVSVLISRQHNLNVLGHILDVKQFDDPAIKLSLPSLAPDWRLNVTINPFKDTWFAKDEKSDFYSASETSTPYSSFSKYSKLLALRGYVFDLIRVLKVVLEELEDLLDKNLNNVSMHLTVVQHWEHQALEDYGPKCSMILF